MTKYYVSKTNSPIVYQAKQRGLSQKTILNALNITDVTYNSYLKNPLKMRLEHIVILAGLFKLSIPHFTELLILNKPQLTTKNKWYLESLEDTDK